ncbi:transketolase family protein [bacterium]|uniref:Transketolase n=2 Tax=Katanobacteria TaxID=422282 RepID=A0A2M7X3H4_UNCKA|nr:transketolase family protein [bacterium]PIP56536.1 MAG: transketolase [candidate division WWE3 bacterium CG22_combo_CG10-13_8_21_14_all_39_12]PJA40725.1 MAG: transketolase [candidate division WWE3 bacterium CG_4_9_14_3_um_filter_39_7]
MIKDNITYPSEEKISTREGFGEGLVEAGKKNSNVVALCADVTESTRVHWFKEAFPDRFIEVGVSEQNLATVASGLAASGKIPFMSAYAVFSPGRNWEQIRTTICYNNVPVKIAGHHAGLLTGPDGATHQALEDIALMRVLPNMTVLIPADYCEAKQATIAAAMHPGPVYIRFQRTNTPVFTMPGLLFEIGKSHVVREGSDVTIVSCGPLVYSAIDAAEALAQQEISVEVINASSIKPFDVDTLITSVQKTGAVVTLEDHQIAGGLGSLVCETVSEHYPVPVKRIGVKDEFGQSGTPDQLYEKYGLSVDAIILAVQSIVR